MPPEPMRMRRPASRSARARSSSICAMTLRAVLAWQMIRTVFTARSASPLLSRPLPEAMPAAEVAPLRGRALVQVAPEVRAGRPADVGAERLREQLGQLGRGEAPVAVEAADGL